MRAVPASSGPRDIPAGIRHRLGQGWALLSTSRSGVRLPGDLSSLVGSGHMAERFARLRPADQAHLVSVARQLANAGWDEEVVAAGLLHDIAKPGGIGLVTRGAWVIVRRVFPPLAGRLAARETAPPLCGGLWLLAGHARSGGALLRNAGHARRVCWLVEHHEHTGLDDPGLQALIAADNDKPVPRARPRP